MFKNLLKHLVFFSICSAIAFGENPDELLQASFFDEAITMYRMILAESNTGDASIEPYLRLKLAQAYLAENKDIDALKALSAIPEKAPLEITQSKMYLLGICQVKLKNDEQALQAFNTYLNSAKPEELLFYEDVLYESGLCHFRNQSWDAASAYFNLIPRTTGKETLHNLAQIYSARIELNKGQFVRALDRLTSLETQLQEGDVLQFEVSFWKGEAFFHLKMYQEAALSFEKALPRRHIDQASWYGEALFQCARSFLKLGELCQNDSIKQLESYQKAEKMLTVLIGHQPDEQAYLALARLYLLLSKQTEADAILSNPDHFQSLEGQVSSLWLKAEFSSNYNVKNQLYKQITDEFYKETTLFPYGWYARGLNDFNEGIRLAEQKNPAAAAEMFEVAAYGFKQAFNVLKDRDPKTAGLAVKYLAEAYEYTNLPGSRLKAFAFLDQLINANPEILNAIEDPGEIYYLHAVLASNLTTWQTGDKFADIAENSLTTAIEKFPSGRYNPKILHLLGNVHYHKKNYAKAEQAFTRLISNTKDNHVLGEVYFWIARCQIKQKRDSETAKTYLKQVYETFPDCRYAAEAYFTYYNSRDYLQGGREAIKHLLEFEQRFPNSPYLITSHYLTGMDFKRDRKSAEGKWIRKKNLIEAIESFQKAETAFDQFYEKGILTEEELPYFVNMRYHSILERALANFSIAQESQGAKKRIYLDYAAEVFKQIAADFEDPSHPLAKRLAFREPFPRLLEESYYWLAQTLASAQNDPASQEILNKMLANYQKAKITRGYLLSRTYYELGQIAIRNHDCSIALDYFKKSEDASKGKVLSVDQKIDLWIQQSMCFRELHELDHAMLLLSKAINDDAVSGLRIKAMYLRAEIYATQGRHELAKKQLDAASKLGGEWALKAKRKLEEDYGYQ